MANQSTRRGPDLQASAQFQKEGEARAWSVTARLNDRGLVLDYGRDQSVTWPYSALQADQRIDSRTAAAVITYPHMPGASVTIRDARLLAQLKDRAPQISKAASTHKLMVTAVVIALCAALVYGLYALASAPISRAIAGAIPVEARQSLGKQLTRSLVKQHGECVSPIGTGALKRLADRLRADDDALSKTTVRVVDWNIVNAFAGPGGAVFLTKGLIRAASSSDEVAGVLAHELGHAKALHPEAGMVRKIGLFAAIELLTGGTGGAAGLIGTQVIGASYQRGDEREADKLGVDMLRSAEVSHEGLKRFFERIKEKRARAAAKSGTTENGRTTASLLSTHPTPNERLRNMASIEGYASRPSMSQADWFALQRICSTTTKTPRRISP